MYFSQRILAVVLLTFCPFMSFSQELDLGPQEASQVISRETLFPFAKITMILFSIYVILGIALLVFFLLKSKRTWRPPISLENFPASAKAAITLAAIAYSFVHILALLEVYLVTKVSFKSTSEYFFYMKLPKLLATSHAHFFGHGTMYLITSLIFIFSKLSEVWKFVFVALALSAGLLDVASWWAIKYGGDVYELFSALAGIMSVIGWGYMTLRILYEFWWAEFFGRKV